VELKSNVLTFALGYSHPVVYKLPDGISASVDVYKLPDGISASVERNRITLSGIDKELLGSTAAIIRGFREPEPYKGKGVKYAEEQVC